MGIICVILQLFLILLLVRIVMSWIPVSSGSIFETIGGFLFTVTEPVLGPLRAILPPVRLGAMALDLSPLVVFLGIQILLVYFC